QVQPGTQRLQERDVLVPAAVVGHLEDVDVESRQHRSQRGLPLRLDVTAQEEPDATDPGQQHDTRVVGGAAVTGADRGRPGWWPDRLPRESAAPAGGRGDVLSGA